MTKLETLKNQRQKAQVKYEDYLSKANREAERIKELDTQIILAKHEERSDYLAKHNLTWEDIKKQIAAGKLKGEQGYVSVNESNSGQDH